MREARLRDQPGAARAIAYLTLAGAPYVLVTGVIWPTVPAAGIAAVVAAALFMTATGLICWLRPAILPPLFWYAAPVVATALVTGLNLGTGDASTGAQLFYLWPVLYAANFLPRRQLYANLALVFAGHAAVVLHVLGAAQGLSDWVAMTLAMTMTTIVVSSLRARAGRLRADLEQQANADPLTGLANRRSFTGSLAEAGEWARRTGGSLALLSIDLDHFKIINDTYGHPAGDAALQAVADSLRTLTGPLVGSAPGPGGVGSARGSGSVGSAPGSGGVGSARGSGSVGSAPGSGGVGSARGSGSVGFLEAAPAGSSSPPEAGSIAARLGGDEFVLLLRLGPPAGPGALPAGPGVSPAGLAASSAGLDASLASPSTLLAGPVARLTAARYAEDLRSLVAANTDLPGGPPSLSIGIATLPADATTIDELLAASDAALYEAKSTGRGRTTLAGPRQNVDAVPTITPAVPHPRP